MVTLEVTEIGSKVKVFYDGLKKDMHKIGTERKCPCCENVFVIGEHELERAKHDYKGRPKRLLELWSPSDFIIDVDLQKTPINLENYTVAEQCVIFGVECLNTKICPDCEAKNKEHNDVEMSMGRPDRHLAE